MSFYDDASLVFLPSGGAGKDGKAYSVKPVPEYGSELVTNGDFATDSDWIKGTGWTISGGTANCDGSSNVLRQANAVPLNTKLYASLKVTNYVSGSLQFKFAPIGYNLNVTKNGVYTIVTNGDNSVNDDIQVVSQSFVGSIDNISVREAIVEGDFTFSRGSNLTATRVDSNGLIEKGRENLLLQSNQFDTTWTNNLGASGTIADNQSGYDGSNDAWLLTKDATTFARVQQTLDTPISGVWTMSAYLKAGTATLSRFRFNSASYMVEFNFSTGIATDEGSVSAIDFGMTDVGNGWYRCYATFNASVSIAQIYVDYNTSTSTTMFVQDAQLEQGLVATEYIESGATTGLAGILEDSPRFDYSGGASCPSLLLEPSRTNLVAQSEYMLGSNWLGGQTSITPVLSPDLSPEGKLNAYRITRTSTDTQLGSLSTVTSGQTYTGSIYIKRVSGSYNARIKVVENTSTTIAITDEWKRFDLTEVATSSNGRLYISPFSTGDVIDVWGAQLEEGSYATSYIPNHSGGSVTRDADSCSGAGTSSTFNDAEGVLYAEIAALADDQTSKVISLSDGTLDERVLITTRNGVSNEIRVFIKSGGSFSATIDATLTDITDFNKIAFRYKSGETKLFVNGSLISTSTDTFSISGLNALQFASGTATATPFYGNAKQVIVFNTALSDSECITLTS